MKNLNKEWLGIIIAGIVFLIGFTAWNVVESISGSNEPFIYNVPQFPTDQLLSSKTKIHLEPGLRNSR